MAATLRYFTDFVKPVFQHVDLWWNLCTSLLYFFVRVQCRRKESSRSLSHLPMSFLSAKLIVQPVESCLLCMSCVNCLARALLPIGQFSPEPADHHKLTAACFLSVRICLNTQNGIYVCFVMNVFHEMPNWNQIATVRSPTYLVLSVEVLAVWTFSGFIQLRGHPSGLGRM